MSDLRETPARLCPSSSRRPLLPLPLICAGLGAVLFGVLLLVACTDDSPTDPDAGVPASGVPPPSAVLIDPSWLTLDSIGATGRLPATVISAEGDTIGLAVVTWSSADSAIASVDATGLLTAAGLGTTKVMATHGSVTATATVEVALPLTDREILEILFTATGGETWTDNTKWLTDEPMSDWYGVRLRDGRVNGLSLRDNNLKGRIPAEIGGLDSLFSLDLSGNELAGPIPPELGKLKGVRDLLLGRNEIEGSLPPEMGGMEGLEYLYLSSTNLSGTVPKTFANLGLDQFYFSRTDLCFPPSLQPWLDSIPTKDEPTICTIRLVIDPPSLTFEALGDTATLSVATIGAEGDTLGTPSVSWSSADSAIASVDSTGLVTAVDFGETRVTARSESLSATVEVEVVFKPTDRDVLQVLYGATDGDSWTDNSNWLTDEPLSEWAGVHTNEDGQVDTLSLKDNNLAGAIPPELGELDQVVRLDLSHNLLSGRIPAELGVLKEVRDLILGHNEIEGLLPPALGYMTGLRRLDIQSTNLAGVVPGAFANLALEALYSSGSQVCVPPSLDDWLAAITETDDPARCIDYIVIAPPSLTLYAIGDTATLSATFFGAEGDTIHAPEVTWSSADSSVAYVNAAGLVTAAGNGTTEVTASTDSVTAAAEVDVAIPETGREVLEAIFNTTGGENWSDNTNWLTEAPLSEWFGVETDEDGAVVVVSLRGNNLRGWIHSAIGSLDQLVTLDLGRNRLAGPIPAEVGNLEQLRDLKLSSNGITGALPTELGNLDSLRTLNVAATSVSGRVPTTFVSLELESFLVGGTSLCVPPSLEAWLGTIDETDDPARCTSIVTVDPPSLTFSTAGDTARLSVTVVGPEGGDPVSSPVVAWASTDTAVAKVDSVGLVTALTSGVTAVTATYDSVASAVDVAVALPGSDRVALEVFYHAAGGDDWTDNSGWLTDAPIDEWFGVELDENERVDNLSLRGNNLTGQIPPAIGLLDQLFILDLSGNALTGAIPPAIGRLQRLRDLSLGRNDISGPVPPEMGGMAGLEYLSLSETRLSGPLPETIANLTLNRLYIGNTDLCVSKSLLGWLEAIPTGPSEPLLCIPATRDRDVLVTLYNTTGGPDWESTRNWLSEKSLNTWDGITTDEEGYVTEIFLPGKDLAGPIPPELGNLGRLEKLALYDNELTGGIPAELGNLTELRRLSLSENELEGPIPPELGNLARLDTLYLSINELSGPIPATFGNLAALERLVLFENQLSGPLPVELGRLKKLKDLWLTDNKIEGPLPAVIGDMTALESISLSRNALTGALPPELGKLGNLESLRLGGNELSGAIPPEIGNLASLERLFLSRNNFSGSIPPELGNLSALTVLWLHTNELTGGIPTELGELANLEDLALAGNQLTGTIPVELSQLPVLEELGLGSNQLTGAIPPELGDLTSLTYLSLAQNSLSGEVPPEIGNLGKLERLYLLRNENLRGFLPRELMNLGALSDIATYETGLCAQIDSEFQEWLDGIGRVTLEDCEFADIERLSLAAFFDETGGGSWTTGAGWNSDATLGSWHGVTVTGGRVRTLSLPNNALSGPIPPEIANLTALEGMDLSGNDLAGQIPSNIGASMGSLTTIRLGRNAGLQGALPFSFTELTRLATLEYADTDLCASPSTTFQAWLVRVDSVAGANCDNPETVVLSLPVVYLTQAIQRPAGDVPLVANRQALLRVFLASDQSPAFFEPAVTATFTNAGDTVHTLTMNRPGDLLATGADESDLDLSYNAVIPADVIAAGVEMVVEADPDSVVPLAPSSRIRLPGTGSTALKVVEVPPMEVTVVPVLEAERPDSSIFEWTDNIADDGPEVGLFRYSFPFSEFTATSRETAHITSLDLDDEDDQWELVLELEVVRKAEDGTGYWYGVADRPSGEGYVRGRARLDGWVSIGKPWDTELAHEVGHTLDLLHAPCGGALGTEPEFPHANGSIGVWGYDFRDGSLVSPERRRDIMGYCYEQGWLSDFYFEKVMAHRQEKEGAPAQALMAAARPKAEMLVLWGGVVGGELRIEPVFSMHTSAQLPERVGPYRIEGVSDTGETEFSLSFTPGEDEYGDKYFLFTIPIEEDWGGSLGRITLTGPEGVVTVDRNDPRSISIVTDPSTGRIRAVLRDWDRPLPAVLDAVGGLEVETTRGIPEAVRLRR